MVGVFKLFRELVAVLFSSEFCIVPMLVLVAILLEVDNVITPVGNPYLQLGVIRKRRVPILITLCVVVGEFDVEVKVEGDIRMFFD